MVVIFALLCHTIFQPLSFPSVYFRAEIVYWLNKFEKYCYIRIRIKIKRGADKFLARSGRKQANVSVRMTWISFGALPCRKKKNWWQLASWCCWNRECSCHVSELVSVLVRPRTYQDSGISFRFGSLTIIVYFLITTAFRKLDPFPSSGEEFSGGSSPSEKMCHKPLNNKFRHCPWEDNKLLTSSWISLHFKKTHSIYLAWLL